MNDYSDYIHFKVDTDKIYVVGHGEYEDVDIWDGKGRIFVKYPEMVLTDEAEAEKVAKDLKNENYYGTTYYIEEIQITDLTPAAEPEKKYYLYIWDDNNYNVRDEYAGVDCEYGRLYGLVSEGFTLYSGRKITYILPETITGELDEVIHNIHNHHKWSNEAWDALYSLDKDIDTVFCNETKRRDRFSLDSDWEHVYEVDDYERVVRVKDGKAYMACK